MLRGGYYSKIQDFFYRLSDESRRNLCKHLTPSEVMSLYLCNASNSKTLTPDRAALFGLISLYFHPEKQYIF